MRRITALSLALFALLCCGCAAMASAEPAPSPTPLLTPEPTPQTLTASIGIAGDILMMTSQINAAKKADGYDFSPSFEQMRPLFESVDVMCANFEGTFAGEEAGYTQPRPTAPPATADDPAPKQPYQSFNAPDELAHDLADAGVDLLSTANNHCLDRGLDGLFRTVNVIRGAGMLQTGAYASEQQRYTPCITKANGITIGFVAAADSLNKNDYRLGENKWAVTRLFRDKELLEREISLCREAGADFIIAFPHWGEQYQSKPNRRQREAAQWLIDCGADAVIGSHPHVVQPLEWLAAIDGRRAPVMYSMSNFISNMSAPNTDYGIFLRLDIQKAPDGSVSCTASYLPTLCLRQRLSTGKTLHQVIPCFGDETRRTAAEPMSGRDMEKTRKAFRHVVEICGTDNATLIDWNEEYDKQA